MMKPQTTLRVKRFKRQWRTNFIVAISNYQYNNSYYYYFLQGSEAWGRGARRVQPVKFISSPVSCLSLSMCRSSSWVQCVCLSMVESSYLIVVINPSIVMFEYQTHSKWKMSAIFPRGPISYIICFINLEKTLRRRKKKKKLKQITILDTSPALMQVLYSHLDVQNQYYINSTLA